MIILIHYLNPFQSYKYYWWNFSLSFYIRNYFNGLYQFFWLYAVLVSVAIQNQNYNDVFDVSVLYKTNQQCQVKSVRKWAYI